MFAFGANTTKGIHRTYNEDKISVSIKLPQPEGFLGTWPEIHFFGIYDGHGGTECSEFLKDNLHSLIVYQEEFLKDPKKAIIIGFSEAERLFKRQYELSKVSKSQKNIVIAPTGTKVAKKKASGSWAVIALFVDEKVYVANVGDSRAILSYSKQGRCNK